MADTERKTAIVTGTSRDVGEYISYGLGQAGWSILGLYRNPQHDADQEAIAKRVRDFKGGAKMQFLRADLLDKNTPDLLVDKLNRNFGGKADAIVINAAGGYGNSLEQAREINVFAQRRLLDKLINNLAVGGKIAYLNSYPAHRFGLLQKSEKKLLGDYINTAQSHNEGEEEVRSRIPEFTERGLRLAIVVGNGLEGTFVTRVLKLGNKEFVSQMLSFSEYGYFPTAMDMATSVVKVVRGDYPTGHTEYVGIARKHQLYPSRPSGLELFGAPEMREGSIMCREEVESIIPHRWPFMFIGGIKEIEFGKRASGWLVDLTHPDINWTGGHFPGYPMVPGVITTEALMQMGALSVLGMPEHRGMIATVRKIDGFVFKKPIIPGEDILLEAQGMDFKEERGIIKGMGHLRALNSEGKPATEGNIEFVLINPVRKAA